MNTEKIRHLRDRLRLLERETIRPFDNRNECCGLTLAQCHTLLEIGNRGEISLVDLAATFGLDTSTLSRTIQGLVRIGLVDRETSAKDRRYIVITLTAQGSRVFHNIENRFNNYFAAVLDRISSDRRDAVVEAVSVLAEAVRRYNESNGCCKRK
ncbi:MAG: MarR family winged helix-turn-helix transcriptional regulator [Candidatus Aminicenantes bacterium]|nr:MarR family winged helix-turn-helix transcriptional regulator [Candidatus Aminicenantes bacterium]